MEYIEDIRSLLHGIIKAQSIGAYTLENSEQIAPIVRRILNKYPQLQQQTQQQIQQQIQQTQQQQMQQMQQTQQTQQKQQRMQQEIQQQMQQQQKTSDELIKKIKAEHNDLNYTISDPVIDEVYQ